MIDLETAAELDQLAARIARIRPMSNSNPHAFYEERSEVASEIRSLATKLRTNQPVTPLSGAATAAQPGRVVSARTIHAGGRTVLVLRRASLEFGR